MSFEPSIEQRKVIETWSQGMAVMAGAGSGKTTTLVAKCAELLKTNSEARFAAVSFTEKSASDLRAKLSKITDLTGHWVMTIHGLCGTILREYPREAGYDGEESMLSEGESLLLWERAIEQVWSDDALPEIQEALERMLARENRDSLWALLRRTRDLNSAGILNSLSSVSDVDSKALSVLSSFVLDRYDRLKRRRGALDFNDLEHGADRALEHEFVRQAYRKKFDLVMVDEFQDTNPVQARIILRFVRPDRSNLCVVGDPKQSIYRFRDADVSVFEEFCSSLPVQVSLSKNFRSRPGILNFTNQVCGVAFESSSMRYEPLIPSREANPEFDPVVQLAVRTPEALARWIHSETQKGVDLQDMALLLRKIRGNEKWLKALTSAGIPIAVGSGGFFWEDPRTREMVAFLKWWENPANTLSGAVFLRAPWVGVPDEELDRWNKKDPTWAEPFFESPHPLARALAPLREKVVRPGELLLSLLIDDKTEDELGATLLGLWHRVEELSSRGLDYNAVIAELGQATLERRREREVPPPRNRGQLSVLTMHGSKGLEFPHVILVDLGKKNRAPNSPTLFWDRVRGAFLVKKDSEGEREEDEVFEEWKSVERSKDLAETKRIFYVAATRAMERLVLVCPELPEKDAKFDAGKVYTEDFWRGWIEASGALSTVPRIPESSDEKAPLSRIPSSKDFDEVLRDRSFRHEPTAFSVTRPRHSVTEWNLLSRCPRAYEWTYIRPHLGAPSEPAAKFSQSPAAGDITHRELGTEVHACLETGDFERLERLEERAGVERFQAARVRKWAESSPYMKAGIAELDFEIPVEGEVLVGSMDRVVETEHGLVVLDFKVTQQGKSPEALLEAYGTQMELYRWALARLQAGSYVQASQDVQTIGGVLVNFSPTDVVEVEVPFSKKLDVEAIARHASRIVTSHEKAIPKPGPLCKFCQFRSECMPEI
jgi:ATP-dependent helicase/nuclease subunit A